MMDKIDIYYNKNLDELKVYYKDTKEPIVYIQGYSKKVGCPTKIEMSLEMLIWLSVHYEEVEIALAV